MIKQSSALAVFYIYMKRDLKLMIRKPGEIANPVIFFVIVVSLFPLAIGSNKLFLQQIAPGVIWVSGLMASMLSLERIFKSDFEDGALEQMLLSCYPPSIMVLAKLMAHWLLTGVPLIIVSPLIGVMFHLSHEAIIGLVISLLLGTPALSMIGAIGVALTVSLKRGGVLLSLMMLPLCIPILILGSSIVVMAAEHIMYHGVMAWLGVILMLALTLVPLTITAALRLNVS